MDICLYNLLARENTRMLSFYASLDRRVKVTGHIIHFYFVIKELGYLVKLFAKICDIGDASKGSLSSYAYILMMVFYLQQVSWSTLTQSSAQVSPPVLPVLQQIYPRGEEKPQVVFTR